MGKEIIGEDAEGRRMHVDEDTGMVSVDLHPAPVMETGHKLGTDAKSLLEDAKSLGLIEKAEGTFGDVFTDLSEKAFSDNQDATEGVSDLRQRLTEFAEFCQTPEAQFAMPVFGIEIFEREGEIQVFFAD